MSRLRVILAILLLIILVVIGIVLPSLWKSSKNTSEKQTDLASSNRGDSTPTEEMSDLEYTGFEKLSSFFPDSVTADLKALFPVYLQNSGRPKLNPLLSFRMKPHIRITIQPDFSSSSLTAPGCRFNISVIWVFFYSETKRLSFRQNSGVTKSRRMTLCPRLLPIRWKTGRKAAMTISPHRSLQDRRWANERTGKSETHSHPAEFY